MIVHAAAQDFAGRLVPAIRSWSDVVKVLSHGAGSSQIVSKENSGLALDRDGRAPIVEQQQNSSKEQS